MSEQTTQNLPDGRSFEERVFARFDGLDAGMARMESRLDGVEARLGDLNTRVQKLESEAERRALDTKPIWERALAEILALKEDIAVLGQKVETLAERVDAVERKLDVFWHDMLTLRTEQRRLEARMDKLESKLAP